VCSLKEVTKISSGTESVDLIARRIAKAVESVKGSGIDALVTAKVKTDTDHLFHISISSDMDYRSSAVTCTTGDIGSTLLQFENVVTAALWIKLLNRLHREISGLTFQCVKIILGRDVEVWLKLSVDTETDLQICIELY